MPIRFCASFTTKEMIVSKNKIYHILQSPLKYHPTENWATKLPWQTSLMIELLRANKMYSTPVESTEML